MCERLDTGDQRDAETAGIGVELLEVAFGISAALMTEVGLPLDLIGILRVELHGVVAH